MLEHDLPPQRQSPLMRAGFTRDIAALEESVDTARAQLDQERPGWVRLDDAPQNGLNALWGRLKRLWGQLNSDHPSLTARIQRLELKRRISS
jgi:Zn-dependent protease with chaperone function